MRSQAIDNRINGEDGPKNVNITRLREQGLYPSEITVDRWMVRRNEHGHARLFCRTGNRRSQREVKHRDLILLALHRAVLHKATFSELNAFIYAMNLHNPDNRMYSYSQLHRAGASILITRKRSSTTAYQAMTPTNIQRRANFWNMMYPFGCIGINPRDMIDLDEAGIYTNGTNRKYGSYFSLFVSF